ncbi:hypothetical protein FB45DRAFT_1065400 [Roridomyces roridus]|uniref:Uncharacterized protein n=1 Tax=Roridomyces roridus TaxID=1738132 RepID=A0AAD7B7R9_9AGAR|nr:hypothetical protein FB45DRAFT_1065400 [Roridomyces roridus]
MLAPEAPVARVNAMMVQADMNEGDAGDKMLVEASSPPLQKKKGKSKAKSRDVGGEGRDVYESKYTLQRVNRPIYTGMQMVKNGAHVAFQEVLVGPFSSCVMSLDPTMELNAGEGHGQEECLYLVAAFPLWTAFMGDTTARPNLQPPPPPSASRMHA